MERETMTPERLAEIKVLADEIANSPAVSHWARLGVINRALIAGTIYDLLAALDAANVEIERLKEVERLWLADLEVLRAAVTQSEIAAHIWNKTDGRIVNVVSYLQAEIEHLKGELAALRWMGD